MQIILLERVANLGTLGDVVKVKDGYARNFLIPQGKAKRATSLNLAAFEERRAELEKAHAALLVQAQERADALAEKTISIAQKAGVDGRLFGSVTNIDIASAVSEQTGVQIVRAEVRLPEGPLKALGEHVVSIALHHDVIVNVTVVVTAIV
jgi:large subunit ribosomal protein L9